MQSEPHARYIELIGGVFDVVDSLESCSCGVLRSPTATISSEC